MEEMNPKLSLYLVIGFAIFISMIALMTIFDSIHTHENKDSEVFFDSRIDHVRAERYDAKIDKTYPQSY